MTILDAAFWAVSLVLAASGATKLAEPGPFAEALAGLRPNPASHASADSGRRTAVAVGLAEIVLAVGALALGTSLFALAVAAAYATFAVVVVLARRRGLASCGCFGVRSGAPSVTHALLNAGSALVAATAALSGPVAVVDGLAGSSVPVAAAVLIAVLGVAALIVVVDTR